jgi:ABC-type transporter Mla MlaB component
MLRITFDRAPESITLKLEGELSGLWVDELRRFWRDLTNQDLVRPVTVDLSDVTFVNSQGRALLERMFREGADLRTGPHVSVTRFILDRLKQESGKEPAIMSYGG